MEAEEGVRMAERRLKELNEGEKTIRSASAKEFKRLKAQTPEDVRRAQGRRCARDARRDWTFRRARSV